MPETWPITDEGTLTIRQNSIFNLKQLYKLFHTFAEENNFRFIEKNFTRKDKKDGSEYQIEYQLERKVTPFILLTIKTEIWSLRTREIEKDKFQGELEVNFDAIMTMDWQKKWGNNAFTKFLLKTYIYYIKKQYFLDYAGKFWEELYELHGRVKSLLNQFPLQ